MYIHCTCIMSIPPEQNFDNIKKIQYVIFPESIGIHPFTGTSSLENPVQKAESLSRCLALRINYKGA